MTGRWKTVSRIVFVLALLAVVGAGCGGAPRPQKAVDRGIPRALVGGWAQQAAAVAAAASAGDDCGARRLADALRDQVVATKGRVPVRLRSSLLTGVKTLANRTTCPPPPTKKTPPAPPDKHPKHDDHGHHKHHGHDGGGNDQ